MRRRVSTAATDRLQRWLPLDGRGGNPALLGYARVSTEDQDCAAQVWQLSEAGCGRIITETGSGADHQRPELARLLACIAAGETLVVVRLDRLARSVQHLLAVVQELDARGAALRSLTDPVDTSSPGGRFVLTVLGAVAELERALIIERTRAGLEAAARAGRHAGNPRLRARDPTATAELAAARVRAARERDRDSLGPWLQLIRRARPATSWTAIAARVAAIGGPRWTGERLRRAWRRLYSDL